MNAKVFHEKKASDFDIKCYVSSPACSSIKYMFMVLVLHWFFFPQSWRFNRMESGWKRYTKHGEKRATNASMKKEKLSPFLECNFHYCFLDELWASIVSNVTMAKNVFIILYEPLLLFFVERWIKGKADSNRIIYSFAILLEHEKHKNRGGN